MTRYRLGSIVSEWDGDDLWIAALPRGQITWIGGVGALVVEALAHSGDQSNPDHEEGLPLDGIMDALRWRVQDLPADARWDILAFLEQLSRGGLILIDDGV